MDFVRIPTATYRLEFNPNFGFAGARAILPYLADLGITDPYASPIFLTRRGSTHGYDIVDPNRLNPELGTEADFTALTDELRRCGMRWLQDIVPNHMAYDGQNTMLMDVIENGPSSEYAGYFDIDWNHPYESIRGKVLAPFLGQFYSESLESGDIQLCYNETGLSVSYFDFSLPLGIESYITVFVRELTTIKRKLGASHGDFTKLLGVLYTLKNLPAIEERRERPNQVRFVEGMLWELYTTNEEVRKWLDEIVVRLNGGGERPAGNIQRSRSAAVRTAVSTVVLESRRRRNQLPEIFQH